MLHVQPPCLETLELDFTIHLYDMPLTTKMVIFFCVHALTGKLCCIRLTIDSYKWLQELAGTVGLAKDRTALVASPTLALDELGVYTVSWHKVALCGGRWYSLTGMFPDAKRSLRRIF